MAVSTLVFPAIEADGRGGDSVVNNNKEWRFTHNNLMMVHNYATFFIPVLVAQGGKTGRYTTMFVANCSLVGSAELAIRRLKSFRKSFLDNSHCGIGDTVSNHFCNFLKLTFTPASHCAWPAVQRWESSRGSLQLECSTINAIQERLSENARHYSQI